MIKELAMEHSLGQMGFNFEGAWLNNKRHGHGTETWAAGKQHEEAWQCDKRNGHGTLYTKNVLGFKMTKQGLWRNDEFIG